MLAKPGDPPRPEARWESRCYVARPCGRLVYLAKPMRMAAGWHKAGIFAVPKPGIGSSKGNGPLKHSDPTGVES